VKNPKPKERKQKKQHILIDKKPEKKEPTWVPTNSFVYQQLKQDVTQVQQTQQQKKKRKRGRGPKKPTNQGGVSVGEGEEDDDKEDD